MTNSIVSTDLDHIRKMVGDRARAFDGQTIVITGCAGFLGFYLVQYFVAFAKELGVKQVIALDTFLLDKPKWLTDLADEHPDHLKLHAFDISTDDLGSIPGADEAGFVVHGASIASPAFYRKFPVETLDANIWGLRRILDFYRESERLKGLLFFSSSEIYGDPDPAAIPTPETYRGNVSCHGPRACYDESKRFGETMAWVYAHQYDLPITIARPFNNFGPGMRLGDKRLPADFARAVIDGRDLVIHSDGTPTRTFCYVADAVAGYLLCLLHGRYDYFNIGIEKPEIMVREFAEICRREGEAIFGYQGQVQYQASDDPAYLEDNPNRRCPDISKARSVLGYNPTILVDEGVKRYLSYLKEAG
ncbi:MAG: NAD-dependent epimerase/dehydratase family protein [Dinoroseobacter sp.]|nr:NAD-dependent epimerase/dehydratase family protein [Dinoroseobacter sp.]MDJ0993880.1 NAD-dependent epimerase/dehydratase family protein [Dinoroseobacter sp.]